MAKLLPQSDSSRGTLVGMSTALVALLLLVAKLLLVFRNGVPSEGVSDRFASLGLNDEFLGAFLLIAAGFLASFGAKGKRPTRLVVSFVAAAGIFLAAASIYATGYVLIKGRSDLFGNSQFLLEDVADAVVGILFGFAAVRMALPALKELRRPPAAPNIELPETP